MAKSFEILEKISLLEKELSEQIKKDFPVGTKVHVKRGRGTFNFTILKHDLTDHRNSSMVYGKSETGNYYWVDVKHFVTVVE